MIEYARIGQQACGALLNDKMAGPHPPSSWQESYSFFQYRLEQWTLRAAREFEPDSLGNKANRGWDIIRTVLHLRVNQLHLLIARAFLCTDLRTAAPPDIWTTSVDFATDTVHVLAQTDASTKEYCFHRAQLNHFLMTALDIAVFAATHEPSRDGSPSANGVDILVSESTGLKARQTTMVALNLLRNQADTSNNSKHLWNTIRTVAWRLKLCDYLFSTPSEPNANTTSQPGTENHMVDAATPNSRTRSNPASHLELLSSGPNWRPSSSDGLEDMDIWDLSHHATLPLDPPPDIDTVLNMVWLR